MDFKKITELNQSTVMEARAIASMQMRMIKILAKTILKPI
jgi:hypothetical protein